MSSKGRLLAQAFSASPVFSAVIENPTDTEAFTAAIDTASGGSVNNAPEVISTELDLPLSNNKVGDFAFIQETSVLYVWSGSNWERVSRSEFFVQLSQLGDLALTVGEKRWYAPANIIINNISAKVGSAPIGASLDIIIKKNGVNLKSLTIPSGQTSNINQVNYTVNQNDYLTVDIVNIGASSPGSDLGIIISYLSI